MKRLVFATAMTLIGCGGGTVDFSSYPSSVSIWEAAMEAYRVGDCDFAEAAFQRVQLDYPARDPKQAEARYFLAECTFARGQRIEAARMFRRVTDEFPRHPLAPDALLRNGDAYADLWKRAALDPSFGETALATYQELAQRYRGTPAAQRAALRVRELNEKFAEKEYRDGRFYQRMRAFDSAIISYREVVASYPQSSFAPRAVTRLIEVYGRIGYLEEQQEMCGYLARYYPEAPSDAHLCAEPNPAL